MSGSIKTNNGAGISQRVTLAARALLGRIPDETKTPKLTDTKKEVFKVAPKFKERYDQIIMQLSFDLDEPARFYIAKYLSESYKNSAAALKEIFSKDPKNTLSFFERLKKVVRSAKVDLGLDRHPKNDAYVAELRYKDGLEGTKDKIKKSLQDLLVLLAPGRVSAQESPFEIASLMKLTLDLLPKDMRQDLNLIFYEELKACQRAKENKDTENKEDTKLIA